MTDNPLLCVVTGMERTGTTLLSQLLNAHPLVAAGFECGLLLRKPAEFDKLNPWWDWLADPELGWALTADDRARLLSAPDHAAAYRILAERKGRSINNPAARDIFRTAPLIFDKTPAYVRRLATIMERTDRPFLVTWKTPEDAWESFRKRGAGLQQFLSTYQRSAAGLGRALARYPDRVTVVSYQSLAKDTARVMEQVAKNIGLPEPHDLTMERYRAKFAGMVEDDDRRRMSGLFARSGFSPDVRDYAEAEAELEPVSELVWALYLADVAEELELINRVMI